MPLCPRETGWFFIGWMGVRISMAPGTPKSVWRMCLGPPGFPDHDPEFRPQLLLVCAGHRGVGHPESLGPPRTVSHPGTLGATHQDRNPAGSAPLPRTGFSPGEWRGHSVLLRKQAFATCFSLSLYFSHSASQIFWLTWPPLCFAGCGCTAGWACPTRSLSGGLKARHLWT